MFIGRITADMTDEDLYTYFSQYGEVTDVYFPKPCRGFAFVTFSNAEAAQKLALEDHIIKVSWRQKCDLGGDAVVILASWTPP